MRRLEPYWYRIAAPHLLLFPLSLIFGLAAALRRRLYRLGWLPPLALPVPVVVVGNITAGGTGKTPLVLWLADFLRERGKHPGIVSRGYGGGMAAPQEVLPESDPAAAGDEAVLLARRSGCPVWAGCDRVAAARALLRAHPECDVVIADDGLQHYRMRRDVEIAVVDGERRFGNGLLLPAGPLREPPRRLREVDAVVINGGQALAAPGHYYAMSLHGEIFYNLLNPETPAYPQQFHGKKLVAAAGIGNPQRFFRHLQNLGLTFDARAFPDHHPYAPADLDLPDADAVLVTEKDAVKCVRFATEKFWTLRVDAEVDDALGNAVLAKLERAYGRQAA